MPGKNHATKKTSHPFFSIIPNSFMKILFTTDSVNSSHDILFVESAINKIKGALSTETIDLTENIRYKYLRALSTTTTEVLDKSNVYFGAMKT